MRHLRFGIIGTGAIAKVHAACLKEMESASLIALSSSSKARAEKAAEDYGVPVYAHYSELLSKEILDAVIITTQSGAHLEPALAAAMAGKHILCEKPIEVTLKRANRMIEMCKNEGVKLGCIFQNRFNPNFRLIRKAIREGYLGKLLMGNASIHWFRDQAYYAESPWKGTIKGDGGAALINQGVHTIDLLLNLMGEVGLVFGKVGTMVHNIEGEDVATASLQFKNGALGSISAGTALFPGYAERLEIFGEKGSAVLEGGNIKEWNVEGISSEDKNNRQKFQSGSNNPMDISYQLHKQQIADFIEAITLDRDPEVTGESSIKALKLILSIYESSERNQVIRRLNG